MSAFLLAAVVIIQTPTVSLVPLQTIHNACGTAGEYDACTRFVAYRLEATCAAGKATVTATFRPLIFLHNLHRLSHEHEHIEDMRAFAARYVTDIEQMTFESESQCRAVVTVAAEHFGEKMRDAAAESLRRIH